MKDLVETIGDLLKSLSYLARRAVVEYTPVVGSIVQDQSTDIRHIEHTLDGLLDPAIRRLVAHMRLITFPRQPHQFQGRRWVGLKKEGSKYRVVRKLEWRSGLREQPQDVLAVGAVDIVEREHRGPVADLLHGGGA